MTRHWFLLTATQSEREAGLHDLREVTNEHIACLEITHRWRSRAEQIRTFRDGRCGNVVNGAAQPQFCTATEMPRSHYPDRRECSSNVRRDVSQFGSAQFRLGMWFVATITQTRNDCFELSCAHRGN
jgi:hypothetical protein